MSLLTLYLFGPPRVLLNETPVALASRKALALLIYLAVTHRQHSRDALATLLWPEQGQTRARSSLRHALWLLNQAHLDEWLDVQRETVILRAGFWCDVDEFQAHYARDALNDAVALYHADFLAGFTLRNSPEYDGWQFLQAEELRRKLANALEKLAHQYSCRQEYETALPYARRWLSLDPLHEPAHRNLMQIYAWAGQYGAAMRQYEECARLLREELDALPEEATRSLYESIRARRLSPPIEPQPNHKTLTRMHPDDVIHNLLPHSAPFYGRERELEELDTLLAAPHVRLVTILGPGGMGKTRLALAIGQSQLAQGRYRNGVFYVTLTSLSTPDHLFPAIAEALGIAQESDVGRYKDAEQRLIDYLRGKQLLLILDNCEHLLGGIESIGKLLRAAPRLQILATSRERLRLQEEHLYPIHGLPYHTEASDPVDVPAFALFLQSARRMHPNLTLKTQDWPNLARICRLVDGMPMALELAASWVNVLSLADIAAEIQNNLDLLEANTRNAPPRQQSIRAVFDSSWQRMDSGERTAFMQLSVFRGGFTREVARAVVGISLPHLVQLADKSLLQFDRSRNRYQIHELLRQYAAEKLAEDREREAEVSIRHCAYYCDWLCAREFEIKGKHQKNAATAIEIEIDNVQTAWNWAVQQRQIDQIQRAMDGLAYFYEWQGRIRNGRTAFQDAAEQLVPYASEIEVNVKTRKTLSKLLAWQGIFTYLLGDVTEARNLLQQSLTHLDHPALAEHDTRLERAFTLAQLGIVAVAFGQADARFLYEQSILLFQALDRPWEASEVMARLGRWMHMLAEIDEAERLFDESLSLKRSIGDRRGTARLLGHLSQLTVEQGQTDRAEQLARESYAIYQELKNRYGMAEGLRQLGSICLWQGKNDEAQRLLEQSLAYCHDLGNRSLVAQVHSWLGLTFAQQGRHDPAHEYARTGLLLAKQSGDQEQIAWSLWTLGWVLAGMGAYADAERVLRESITMYRHMSAAKYRPRRLTWSLSLLAYVLAQQYDYAQANEILREALPLSLQAHAYLPLLTAVLAAAQILAHAEQVERAVELFTLARRYPHIAHAQSWVGDAMTRIAARTQSLTPEAAEAAQRRGPLLDIWQEAASLLVDLPKQQAPSR